MLEKDNTGRIVVGVQGKLARLVHDSEALISSCMKLLKGAHLKALHLCKDYSGARKPTWLLRAMQSRINSTCKRLYNSTSEAKCSLD